MPHEDIRAEDTRQWLAKAADDLRGAGIDLAAEPPLLEDALFHCQQATEKSLKAYLAWNDVPFRKTHDLVELGGQCVDIDKALEPLLRTAAPLTEYAWLFRYPGDHDEPAGHEAEDAFALAGKIHEAVITRVPEKARP